MIAIIFVFLGVTYTFAQQGNPGCLLLPIRDDPGYFQVNTPMAYNRRFPCPPNTLFDPKQCGCGWVDNPVNPTPDQLKRSNRFGMIDRTPGMMGGRLGQGMGQGMGQGKGPDMGQGMGPGIGPVMGPGMGPGMGPDMGPGKGPGYVPGMGPGGQGGMTYPPTTTTRGPCLLKAHRDRHLYKQFIQGLDWNTRRCPMGTLFNQEACACHDIDPEQKYICQPELWINFNGREIEDSGGYQISVGNNGNVVNVSNAGRFDGTGTLTVWQYANQDFGTGVTINLRFYEFPGGVSDEQVLISNCYGRKLGSIEIALDTKNKMVIFRCEAQIGRYPEAAELVIPYREKAWKNVTLAYDGNLVRASVDDEFKSAPMKGHITTRYNGILIGSCNGRGYVGYIDDLRLYRCLLDQTPPGPEPYVTGAGDMGMGMGMNPMENAGAPMM